MAPESHIDVSIVVPMFNEEESIVELFDRIKAVMTEIDKDFEVIFVDDGSEDNSASMAKPLPSMKSLRITQSPGLIPRRTSSVSKSCFTTSETWRTLKPRCISAACW